MWYEREAVSGRSRVGARVRCELPAFVLNARDLDRVRALMHIRSLRFCPVSYNLKHLPDTFAMIHT